MAEQIQVAQVIAISWPGPDGIKYYGNIATDKVHPFRGISLTGVEARLLVNGFIPFKLFPDLTDEDINITLGEVYNGQNDLEIQRLFSVHGAGVRVELFYYYPQVDLLISRWFGQLSAPNESNYETFVTKATNGFMSRLMISPKGSFYESCQATFGAFFATQEEIDRGPCPYNRHIGGMVGNLDGGEPFARCKHTLSDCQLILGDTLSYYGYNITASATVANKQGQLAVSRGNISNLRRPLRRVYGFKTIRDLDLLLWKREPNISHPDKGFVAAIWACHDGQCSSIYDFKVNDGAINVQASNTRLGEYRQPPTAYAPDVSNFSGKAHIFARLGWVNAAQTDATNLKTQITGQWASDIRVYSDEDTYTVQFTNNRVWCLMDVYANQNQMNGLDYSRFNITDWGNAANWADTTVTFTDNQGGAHTHRRTQFDCDMQGRQSDEQIRDICISGRVSIPYQKDGKLTITPLTKISDEDLENAPVFSDRGNGRAIEVNNGIPQLSYSQIPDDKLINECVLTFEDSANGDIERPISVIDEEQQYKAGRSFGDNSKIAIQNRRVAFGIRHFDECVKLAHALLYLGELDEGGIANNLEVVFSTAHVNTLDLKKHQVIKIDSRLLDNLIASLPFVPEPFFRIKDLQQQQDGRVLITTQVYPKDYYDTFEVEEDPEDLPESVPEDSPLITGIWEVPIFNLPTSPAFSNIEYKNGFLEIEVTNA
jgi:hypothetical protein